MDFKILVKNVKCKLNKFYEKYKDIFQFIFRIMILVLFGIILMHILNVSNVETHKDSINDDESIKKEFQMHKNCLKSYLRNYLAKYRGNIKYKKLTNLLNILNASINNTNESTIQLENKIRGALLELNRLQNSEFHNITTNLQNLLRNIQKLKKGHGF